jgi:ParB family transcriptional regulator, chromosome partitioning protein
MLKTIPLSQVNVRGVQLPKRDDPRVVALVESIGEIGQLQPVLLDDENRLVCGRHRYVAHQVLKLAEIDAHISDLSELALRLARIDENLIRQTFTALERAEQFEERKRVYEALHPTARQGGAPGKKGGGKSKGATIAGFAKDTAVKTGTAERTVQQYVQVAARLDPKAKETIKATTAADDLTGLTCLSRMASAEQQAVAARVAETGESVKRAQKSLRHAEQVRQVRKYVPPDDRFNVVTVDFSWEYDDKLDGSDAVRGGCPYPPMPIAEIVAFIRGPLARCCDEVCLLGNWITGPMSLDLRVAPVVQAEIEALGFRALHERIWEKEEKSGKDFVGLGRPVRWNAEKLQLYVRGGVVFNDLGEAHGRPIQSTTFRAPVGDHSEKPQRAYDDLEQLVPYTKRLEMFARAPRKGWATSGAEMPKAKKRLSFTNDVTEAA